MGIVFALIFLAGAAIFGTSCLVLGIFGIRHVRKRNPQKHRKLVTVGSIASTAWGGIVLLFVLCCIGYFLYVNITPPADFVPTDIVIEENGFQDSRFTADGVVYVRLPFDADYETCKDISTPVFSYYTKGLLNGSQCGNYHRIEQKTGFDLVWDGNYLLFCPESQYDAVVAYYEQSPRHWYLYHDEQYQKLDGEFGKPDTENRVAIAAKEHSRGKEILIEVYSADGLVRWSENLVILIIDQTAYTDVRQDGGQYTAAPLPADATAALLGVLQK